MQLEKDTDPSFQKVEAPLARWYPNFDKGGDIIGYKKSKIHPNLYSVKKLSEVWILDRFKISDEFRSKLGFDPNLLITMQKYDANENRMVCIHKENYVFSLKF